MMKKQAIPRSNSGIARANWRRLGTDLPLPVKRCQSKLQAIIYIVRLKWKLVR